MKPWLNYLSPLLVEQRKPISSEVKVFDGEEVHLDLTLFRQAGFALDKGGHWPLEFFHVGHQPEFV